MSTTGEVMLAGTGHKTLVFLGFMLVLLGLTACGGGADPESDVAPVTELAQPDISAATPTPVPTLVLTPTPVPPTQTAVPTTTPKPAPTPTPLPPTFTAMPTRESVLVTVRPNEVSESQLKMGQWLDNVPDEYRRFFGCSGTGPVEFDHAPMRFEDFSNITPYGLVGGGHVTPIDHMYFAPKDMGLGRHAYEVRAIQDGVIYDLQPRDFFTETGQAQEREWRMDIAHTCTFHSYFDLLSSLEPWILAEWEKTQGGETGSWVGIPIKSGQVVGRIGVPQSLDFGVYNYETVLPGYVFPEHYDHEPWKIHTVDPFPYFPTEIREVLLQRNLRKVEPLAGKIDYDIDGTLSGNWFQQGTNWYAGVDGNGYWSGHLSIAPEHIDPTQWIFSIGHWPGEHDGSGTAQYLIVNADPNPQKVDVKNGIVKYELGYVWYCSVEETERCGHTYTWDGSVELYARQMTENVHEPIAGVALVQMLEDRLLKVEAFPGKKTAEVEGFTSAATLYER